MTYNVKSHYDIQVIHNALVNKVQAGNMQLPYNSPDGYLVHVLFSQCVYFPINGPGRPFGKLR